MSNDNPIPNFLNRKLNPVKVTRIYTKDPDLEESRQIKKWGKFCRDAKIKYCNRKRMEMRELRKKRKGKEDGNGN